MTIDVTELGIERQCTKCGDWWPLDGEFYHRHPRGYLGFASSCRACRTTGVFTTRLDEAQILAMLRAGRHVQDIAATVGCSEGAVYKRQKAYRKRAA